MQWNDADLWWRFGSRQETAASTWRGAFCRRQPTSVWHGCRGGDLAPSVGKGGASLTTGERPAPPTQSSLPRRRALRPIRWPRPERRRWGWRWVRRLLNCWPLAGWGWRRSIVDSAAGERSLLPSGDDDGYFPRCSPALRSVHVYLQRTGPAQFTVICHPHRLSAPTILNYTMRQWVKASSHKFCICMA